MVVRWRTNDYFSIFSFVSFDLFRELVNASIFHINLVAIKCLCLHTDLSQKGFKPLSHAGATIGNPLAYIWLCVSVGILTVDHHQ